MDTHIANHHTVDQDAPPLSARLPDEPGGTPPPDDGAADLLGPQPGDRPAQSSLRKPRRGRGVLLAGVAVVALVAGGGAFLLSPYNHILPVPGFTAQVRRIAEQAGIAIRKPLAPSASLASVALPPPAPPVVRDRYTPKPRDEQVSELLSLHPMIGSSAAKTDSASSSANAFGPAPTAAAKMPAGLANASPAAPSSNPPGATPPSSVQFSASSSISPPLPPLSTPAMPASSRATGEATVLEPRSASPDKILAAPAAEFPVGEPGSRPAAPVAARVVPSSNIGSLPATDVTSRIIASVGPSAPPLAAVIPAPIESVATPVVKPQPPVPAMVVASAAAPRGLDAAVAAETLRAAPMTSSDQVQVLNLVTEMARMVRELRLQDTQLRGDLRKTAIDNTARLDDFSRRLALAEARATMAGAAQAADTPSSPSPDPLVVPVVARAAPVAITSGAISRPATGTGVPKRFRVQAASPGLALLAEVDRGGGEGAQRQVSVGDTLPDLGRITLIGQKGTSWVVVAEHGSIQ